MAYEVTASRRRPQSFDQLVGQEFVVASIRHSLREGRIAHAYLLAGPRGVGKTTVARLLARSLNCERGPTPEPCGTCSLCREVARGAALDVIEIDGASNTSVNDVRQIRDEVLFAPNAGRYKVYIIDEVHMLSNSAFNALLKTIEEPPPYVVFIFATTEIHKVPATIRSRCQQFAFRLIPLEDTVRLLEEAAAELGVHAESDALYWIAKESTGSMRDAYTLLDQAASFAGGELTLAAIREKLGVMDFEMLNDLADGMLRHGVAEVLERTHEILASGVSIEQFTADLAEYFRNVLLLKHGITRRHLLGYPPEQFRPAVVESFGAEQLEKAVELLLELHRNLRYTLNPVFELELVVARLTELDRLVTPTEVLDLISTLREELRAGGGIERPAGPPTKPVSRPAATARADAVPVREAAGDGRTSWARIVDACKAEKPLLAPALEKVVGVVAERSVTLSYRSEERFYAQMVEADRALLVSKAQAVLGRPVSVEIEVQGGKPKAGPTDEEPVDLVKRVFRGEEVEDDRPEGGV
jgi:DNA polymerase-3 subunit gamma/tau